jgi:hypothetical protein
LFKLVLRAHFHSLFASLGDSRVLVHASSQCIRLSWKGCPFAYCMCAARPGKIQPISAFLLTAACLFAFPCSAQAYRAFWSRRIWMICWPALVCSSSSTYITVPLPRSSYLNWHTHLSLEMHVHHNMSSHTFTKLRRVRYI